MIKVMFEGLMLVALCVATYYFLIVVCALMDRCANYYMGF